MRSWVFDYTNLDDENPSVNPNGKLRDETSFGAKDGTLLSESLLDDWYQTFYKIFREGSPSSPNRLPENETNGYQLYDALVNAMSKSKRHVFLNQTAGDDTTYDVAITDDILTIGSFVAGMPDINLPVDSFFTGKTIKMIWNQGNAGGLYINSITPLTLPQGISTGDLVQWIEVYFTGTEWIVTSYVK